MRRLLRAAAAAAVAMVVCAPAPAQDYPTRSITLIVPYPAGGGVDALARVVAEKFSVALGQQVVVDNRAGGSALVGTRAVKESARQVHAVSRPYRVDRDQPEPLYECRLRSPQGLRADRPDRVDAGCPAGASLVPREHDRRGGCRFEAIGCPAQYRHAASRDRR